MKDKFTMVIVASLAVILLLVFANSAISADDSVNRTNITLEDGYRVSLHDLVNNIKNDSYYEGYDNDTVAWMESLGSKVVFLNNDSFIIMDHFEAHKIPAIMVCDAYLYQFVECDVIENHSLGNTDHPRDVVYVRNVEFLGENIVGNGLA